MPQLYVKFTHNKQLCIFMLPANQPSNVLSIRPTAKALPMPLGSQSAWVKRIYPKESIQLSQHFRTLTPDNQRALLEIAKVLNRLQRNS